MVYDSGALHPDSIAAIKHAEVYYKSIRHRDTDIFYISRNTEFSYEQVSMIKGHIFYNKHDLSNGFERFAPDYRMSESWRRLSLKNGRGIQEHDIIMLKHELLELQYMSNGDCYSEAHDKACLKYNYQDACKKYYERAMG